MLETAGEQTVGEPVAWSRAAAASVSPSNADRSVAPLLIARVRAPSGAGYSTGGGDHLD